MKVLCDVHIAKRIVRFFISKGIESVHVNDILNSYYTKDNAIANYANENGFTVMTKDEDFKNSHLLKSQPKQLLKVNLGNIATPKLIEILDQNFSQIETAFSNKKCLVEINKDSILVYIGT